MMNDIISSVNKSLKPVRGLIVKDVVVSKDDNVVTLKISFTDISHDIDVTVTGKTLGISVDFLTNILK